MENAQADDIPTPPPTCPRCGHPVNGGQSGCQCPASESVGTRLASTLTHEPKVRVPWRFDLRSIMLLVLVIAVGLGLSLQLQTAGLGVPLLLLGPATVIRASPILVDRKQKGRSTDLSTVLGIIGDSFGVVIALVVASSIAFVAVCFPTGYATFMVTGIYSNTPAFISLGAGTIAVFVVLYFLGRRIFPPKD